MSLSVLSRRVAAPMCARAFTTAAPRMDFGWSKLVTPLTSPAFISRMKELDTKFAAMKGEMHGVAPKVEPIDWAFYEANIHNKDMVAQLKKEYENMKFEDIQGEDLSKINADLDFAISKASGAAAISKEEIPRVRSRLSAAIVEKKEVHNWTREDYFKAYPGLEEELRQEYMNGQFLPTEFEEKLAATDFKELRKQLKAGQELTLPEGIPEHLGAEEEKRVDAMLNKMFQGSKQFEAMQSAYKAKKAKRQAANQEHHH